MPVDAFLWLVHVMDNQALIEFLLALHKEEGGWIMDWEVEIAMQVLAARYLGDNKTAPVMRALTAVNSQGQVTEEAFRKALESTRKQKPEKPKEMSTWEIFFPIANRKTAESGVAGIRPSVITRT